MSNQPDVKCECGHEASLHANGMGCAEQIWKGHGLGPILCACPYGEKQVLRAALAASETALAEAREQNAKLTVETVSHFALMGFTECAEAKNFIAWRLKSKDGTEFEVSMQKVNGKTPMQYGNELKAQLTERDAQLAAANAEVDRLTRDRDSANARIGELFDACGKANAEVERLRKRAQHFESWVYSREGKLAAERQRIVSQVRYAAQLLRGSVYHSTRCQCLNTDVCVVVLQRDIERAAMGLDDDADRIASGGFAQQEAAQQQEVRDGVRCAFTIRVAPENPYGPDEDEQCPANVIAGSAFCGPHSKSAPATDEGGGD